MREHPSGAQKCTSQRFKPEDSSCVEQGNVTNLASENDNLRLPHLDEGPDYEDQVRCRPDEIARDLFPVVKEEHSCYEDHEHTEADKPCLEEGPDYKDQARNRPGEISRCVLPVVKEGPTSIDQANAQSNRRIGTLGGNLDNHLRTRIHNRVKRWSNQMVTGQGGAGHQDSSAEQDIENNDETSDQDPSLVNAILVDNTTIVEAERVTESKTLKNFIWLFALVVVAAGGLALILLLLQESPERPPKPTTGPTMDRSPFSCDLDIKTTCNFENEISRLLLPCGVWAPPQQPASCEYRPLSATLLFIGGGCEQSDNLDLLNFTCTDSNGGPPFNEGVAAFIQVRGRGGSGPILFEGPVAVGEVFPVSGVQSDVFVDFLDDDLKVSVFTPDQSLLLQEVNHVSLTCSSPLEFPNRYGSVQVVEFYNMEQGLVSLFANITLVLQITVVIAVSDDEANTTLTELTAMTNFGGDLNFTDIAGGVTVYPGNPFEIITGEVSHDDFSLHNYTLAFAFDGISNLGGSFCNGTDSSWFPVGNSGLDIE